MLGNNFKGLIGFFGSFCANGKISTMGPNRSKQTDFQKSSCFDGVESFRPLFSMSYRVLQTPTDNLEEFKGFSDRHCGSY